MRGITHGISAGAAYAACGEYVQHATLPVLATGTAVAIGAGVLSDLDTRGSCVARSFGWVSELLAAAVSRLAGGHREGTHSGAGDVVCALLATLAIALEGRHFHGVSVGRAFLGTYLALLFGGALKALRLIHKDHRREIVAVAAAVAMAWTGWDSGGIAWAILIGTACHALGDGITKRGVPYFEPFSDYVVHLLPEPLRISTGHFTERVVIAPAFLLALGFLAARAVDPSEVTLVTSHLYALA